MVWEQNSNVIVMISNFVERGRVGLSDNDLLVLTSRKCDKYWPSSGHQTYGNVSVRMISEVVRAFFTIRVFTVRHIKTKRGSKDRLVYHYQYTDWRDFDVPPSPLPVLKFVEASVTHWTFDKGPIVVHCREPRGSNHVLNCLSAKEELEDKFEQLYSTEFKDPFSRNPSMSVEDRIAFSAKVKWALSNSSTLEAQTQVT
ncbi:unnamed protein product [Schistosoma curassoni]|uniref:Tyrosine-protein phosphatase domain-containing protein n=1 Tax=Schistosoma curassoni TaxID=6186 RepID=A0A183JM68_9TREM|nr:unnamed protein product [Schistosoma curassoni]